MCSPNRKTCANSFFDISFVYAAPTLWNAFDSDIRLLPFDTFKKKCQCTSLSELLCKLIRIISDLLLIVLYNYIVLLCVYR